MPSKALTRLVFPAPDGALTTKRFPLMFAYSRF
jgi:hypothetical protein